MSRATALCQPVAIAALWLAGMVGGRGWQSLPSECDSEQKRCRTQAEDDEFVSGCAASTMLSSD
eukprot:363940-Chlamydomonas_euryale.AAC.8